MRGRVVGAVAVLVVLGAGAGFGLGALTQSDTVSFATPEPVPAISPSAPIIVPRVATPDPDYPPLPVVMHDHRARLPNKGGYQLRLRVPDGWQRFQPDPQVPTFTFVGPDDVLNTYVMRVQIVAGTNQTPAVFLAARLAALTGATGVSDLDVESQTDDGASATLVATYFDVGDFHRLTMQRWVSFDGGEAYATVAVTGRLADRDGLAALLERTSASLQPA